VFLVLRFRISTCAQRMRIARRCVDVRSNRDVDRSKLFRGSRGRAESRLPSETLDRRVSGFRPRSAFLSSLEETTRRNGRSRSGGPRRPNAGIALSRFRIRRPMRAPARAVGLVTGKSRSLAIASASRAFPKNGKEGKGGRKSHLLLACKVHRYDRGPRGGARRGWEGKGGASRHALKQHSSFFERGFICAMFVNFAATRASYEARSF